jgi:hypothetical protein
MRLRYKVMLKANLTSWVVVFCLASLAMPLVAQQAPATPDAVRKALNPPAPTKPAAGANPAPPNHAASAGAAEPKQAQTPKPALPPSSAIKPAPPAPKPASGSVPSSPVGTATSNATAKPASNSATKPASGATPGSKAAPGTAGNTIKPAAGSASKVPSGAEPSSTAKPPKSKSVTAAESDVPTSAIAPAIRPVAVRENVVRRDPFAPLLGRETSGGSSPLNLPPGKPGLLISSLRIDGIVSAPNGMIAIVSNAQDRVYFLREGDRLYDGQVEHITIDGISFHQTGKDPFGNSVEREVAKRLNSTPGEQQ